MISFQQCIRRIRLKPFLFMGLFTSYCLNANAAEDVGQYISELPSDYTAGFIEVPENWSQPEGSKINIFYYGRLLSDNRTPIVVIPGGPGGNSHTPFAKLELGENHKKMNSKVPFVFFDPRGTGFSSTYPRGNFEESVARLLHYSSRDTVKDLEFLRKKLFGNKKWRIYGHSYGSVVVASYLRDAPEGIEAAFSSGFTFAPALERALTRHLHLTASGEEFYSTYPKSKLAVNEAFALAKVSSIKISYKHVRLTVQQVLDMAGIMFAMPSNWKKLDGILSKLIGENGELNQSSLHELADWLAPIYFGSGESLSNAVISAIDTQEGNTDAVSVSYALVEGERHGVHMDQLPISEMRFYLTIDKKNESAYIVKSVARHGHTPYAPEKIKANLDRYGIPYLLFLAERDSLNPPGPTRSFAETLGSNACTLFLAGVGHDSWRTSSEILERISAPIGSLKRK